MTVLCVLGGSADRCSAQLSTSISLAKALGSPLRGLLAMPDPANTAMYFVSAESVMAGASGVSAVQKAQDELRTDVSDIFDRCTADAGGWLRAELQHETGPVHALAAAHAILSDATVFPREAGMSGHPLNPVFEYTLMEERLPAVLASGSGEIGGPAIIAWDGSPRAMRAVRAHLPLLQAFGEATDRIMEIVGCDADYIATGGSYFTVETHIRHLDEVRAGTEISVRSTVIDGSGKKMHLFHEMLAGDRLLATGEHMLLHVSLETRKTAPPADHIAQALEKISTAQEGIKAPEGLGRGIGQKK